MTVAVVGIAACVAVAVVAARGPGGRRAGSLTPVPPGGGLGWRRQAGRVPWGGAGRGPMGARRRGRGRVDRPRDLAVVVTEVASQLRAGSDPGRAWAQVLGSPVGRDGTPDRDAFAALGESARSQASAVVAACALSRELGAPLAQVLERVAVGLAAAAEADGERRASLAGPRATARVLTGLPILGVVLGAAVGADPVGVLLGGGVGTVALAAGVGLLLAGRWWISRLVRRAERAGLDP